MVFMVFANLHLINLFFFRWWVLVYLVIFVVETFSKKLKLKGHQPTNQKIRTDFSWIEFCQKSWNYFHEHDLRRAFRLPCLQKRLKKFSREQSNVSTGQPYDDALPDWRCIKCISNARMQLFFVKLVLKLNWGQKMLWSRKVKTRNKQFEFWSAKTTPGLPLLFYTGDFSSYHMLLLTLFCQINWWKGYNMLQWNAITFHVAKNGPKIMNCCDNVK